MGVSPAISVDGSATDVARYEVKITNIDVLLHTPWQANLPASRGGVAEAAASNYIAPCPGEYQTYRYRFEVLALNAFGQPVGYGSTVVAARSLAFLVRSRRGGVQAEPEAVTGPGVQPEEPFDFLTGRERERGAIPVVPGANYRR